MSDPSIRAGVATRVWSPGVVWARVSPLILAGLAYILLVCFAYTPIIASLSSAIPGTSQYEDFAIFHWNLWWFQHAIFRDRKSTRLNSSHGYISYTVFC